MATLKFSAFPDAAALDGTEQLAGLQAAANVLMLLDDIKAYILTGIGGGAGDVVGPASAVTARIATFDGVTGKLIQDGGKTIADVIADALAALAAAPVGIPQNAQSGAYTLVIGDANKHLLHPAADTTARIWTIPANASVAFPIGTAITFVNQNAAGVITIAITTDTMRLAGTGSSGSRTLAANGIATALKITATEWIISGTGLT